MAPKKYEGNDRRVDVENIEFKFSLVIKIIIAVAIIVASGLAIQYQIIDNTKRIEATEQIQKHKIGRNEFTKFKKWVKEEI